MVKEGRYDEDEFGVPILIPQQELGIAFKGAPRFRSQPQRTECTGGKHVLPH